KNNHCYYFSEDGLTSFFDFKLAYYNSFQMPYINRNDVHQLVEWMEGTVFYEIFVDRFVQGKKYKNTDYINTQWGEIPNTKSFTGGDIVGITQKLDYIKDLGANGIYLTPIFQSISNHKYDISDYKKVDEQFGSNEEFRKLVDE